eukprot:13945071-Ditylum_brightwellii.AAC.1
MEQQRTAIQTQYDPDNAEDKTAIAISTVTTTRNSDVTNDTSAGVVDATSIDEANVEVPDENNKDEASAEVSGKIVDLQTNITNKQVDEMFVKELRATEDKLDAATRYFWETVADFSMGRDRRREWADKSENNASVQNKRGKEIKDKEV